MSSSVTPFARKDFPRSLDHNHPMGDNGIMSLTPRLVLCAYYETLHQQLISRRDELLGAAPALVKAELIQRFSPYTPEQRAAYTEAVEAFLDERIEMYNPIGAQYAIGDADPADAFELQLELEWYDARAEYARLAAAARKLIAPTMTDADLPHLAARLIRRCGAWPDASIIAAYNAAPAPNYLPDYVLARLIEQHLCADGGTDHPASAPPDKPVSE